MPYTVIPVTPETIPAAVAIWNQVVEDGVAFPQTKPLTLAAGTAFFVEQTLTAVAVDEDGTVLGMYILHPNNIGRCGHLANASYAVERSARGRAWGRLWCGTASSRLKRTALRSCSSTPWWPPTPALCACTKRWALPAWG